MDINKLMTNLLWEHSLNSPVYIEESIKMVMTILLAYLWIWKQKTERIDGHVYLVFKNDQEGVWQMVKGMAFQGANKNLMTYWIKHLWFGRNTNEARKIFTNTNEQAESSIWALRLGQF